MDYEIRQLSNQLIDLINSKQLPIEVKRLVLAEIYSKVSAEANKQIIEQQKIINGGENELSENNMEE